MSSRVRGHSERGKMGGTHKTEAEFKLIWDTLDEAVGRPEHGTPLYDAIGSIAMLASWDDAIHISAPWEPRSTLCGNWERNMRPLDGERPNGIEGCWTCLQAADWFDRQKEKS